MSEKNDLRRLSKKDLLKMYIYSQAFVSGFNYSKQEAPGFTFSMIPVVEKVYDNEPEKIEAYKRHTELFLTEARLSHFVLGITAAMEERNAVDKDIDPISINAIKAALMGPLAGIGDSLYHGTLRPIMAGLAVSLVIGSNYTSMVGPVLFLLVMAVVGQLLRYFGIMKGYQKGVELVEKIQSGGLLQKMTRLASIAAYVVIGGFVYKFVTIKIPFAYTAGETTVAIQSVLDGMIPGLLPLLYTLLMLYLMDKKKMSPVVLMLVTMLVGVVGFAVGFLG
ncbi:PTS system mannose/fructose/sorbose family transporter subunit IID [Clostridium polynesiense]|uniref:PTS system mannose/fructose/sorbose family transporter subunit IID n=1 Tax=Clostridium polynesiense TaxID=1325933 RepID=UPI00058E1079|nr:PTS system mannose/fructose/sorbose family transporter subunit IID [Clostridium polynesiense]